MTDYKTAFGVTSKCDNNSHIYMGDIDKDLSIHKVKNICMQFQKEFNLSTIYIVSSSHGYNLFSLDKLPLKMVYLINNSHKLIDPVFNKLAFMNRGLYVLRTLPCLDKFVVDFAWSKNRLFVKSNAHRLYFNNLFDLFIDHDLTFDDSERIELCRFKNIKYGWKLDNDNPE